MQLQAVAGHSLSVSLRPFRGTDLETLYRIDRLCFAPGIAYSRAELRYYIQHPKSFTVIAEIAGQGIAGFCTGQLQMREGHRVGHIITIDVLPEARRHGAGRVLLRTVEEHFEANAARSMHLEVAVDNFAAQSFYHCMGYTQAGMIRGYYAGKLDALLMESSLRQMRN